MKRIITILTILGISLATMAQVPQKISYQALIRDAENEIVANRVITLQIQLVTANGDAVYSETHQTATNANGVVSVAIGTGTTTDDFSQIDWSKGEFYLQTTIDLGAGEKLISGNSPLLSVPYALYAEKAGNVVEVDLSGYALKEEIPAPTDLTNYVRTSDLAEYAKTSAVNDTLSAYLLQKDVPTKLSQFENDANYITLSNVPETDLSDYYKKSDVNDTLSAYMLQKNAPTKVSQFENDANYITLNEVPETDLSGYYTKSAVNDTLSAYMLQKNAPTKVSQLENDANYITLSEVPETDLSDYYTKSEVDDSLSMYLLRKDAPTKVSQLENDANYITLSEVPATDLSGYYTKSEIDDAFVNYTTTAELNTTFADYAKKDTLADYAKKSEVAGLVDLSEYYLKTDVDALLAELNEKVKKLDRQLNPIPEGAIPAAFSISADKQVYFSQGDLQFNAMQGTHACADGTTKQGTWRFAENQYDVIGNANKNISSTYSGWIDLFGWGTSGWNSGANAYQPYDISTSYSDYYPGGSYSNNLTDSYANADWGVYNAISNGGNMAGQWRTLTNDEWSYLINTRANASSKKGVASVNGVNGLILLPDEWTLPEGIVFTNGGGDSYGSEYYATVNSYTASEWSKMEANGAVFLPAVGFRSGTGIDVYGVGTYGNCWSSSADGSGYPFCLYFDGGGVWTGGNYDGIGQSVRLVQDVK